MGEERICSPAAAHSPLFFASHPLQLNYALSHAHCRNVGCTRSPPLPYVHPLPLIRKNVAIPQGEFNVFASNRALVLTVFNFELLESRSSLILRADFRVSQFA